jgi:hypothetical protein
MDQGLNTEFREPTYKQEYYIMWEILKGGKLGFRRTAGDVTYEVLTGEMIKVQVFCDVTLHH